MQILLTSLIVIAREILTFFAVFPRSSLSKNWSYHLFRNIAIFILENCSLYIQYHLSDVTLDLPIDSKQACTAIEKLLDKSVPLSTIEDLLQKFAAQQLIE